MQAEARKIWRLPAPWRRSWEAQDGEKDRTGAVERAEGAPDQADAVLGKARREEHPDLLEQKAGHAADEEDDDDLVPAQLYAVQVLLDGLLGGAPAGKDAAEAADVLGTGELALQHVLGALERLLGTAYLVAVELLALREPVPEVHDHANEALHHGKEEHERDDGKKHGTLRDPLAGGRS